MFPYATHAKISINTRRDCMLWVDYIHIQQIFGLTMRFKQKPKINKGYKN